jgi:hypothetical protein
VAALVPGAETASRAHVVDQWSHHAEEEGGHDSKVLAIIAAIASNTDGQVQDVLLAILAGSTTRAKFTELLHDAEVRRTGGDAFQRAQRNFSLLQEDGTLASRDRGCRVKESTITMVLKFIKEVSLGGIRPGRVRHVRLDGERVMVRNAPYYIVSGDTAELFVKHIQQVDSWQRCCVRPLGVSGTCSGGFHV